MERSVINDMIIMFLTNEINGSNIILETKKGTETVRSIYNEQDELIGFEYNKNHYFYVRDLLGKITEIIDKNGSVMVSYTYDAWGNWINKDTASIGTTLGDTLVIVNPFIYKGYYYDRETDWYYLKSRYYSPLLSRFISIDNVSCLEPKDINSVNLYLYCSNNPVMGTDSDGDLPFFVITTLVGGAIGLAVGVLYAGAVASSFTASTTAVITGTKTVAAMYATGCFTAGTLMIIDNLSNLSNAVNQFTHVFWSGGDIAKNKDQYVAPESGGKTLEMTRLGRYLESISSNIGKKISGNCERMVLI